MHVKTLILLILLLIDQKHAPLPSVGIPVKTTSHHQGEIETSRNEAYVLNIAFEENSAYNALCTEET